MKTDYLIIGAGIAGTSAAEEIRARDEHGSIVLVGDEPHALYSRVMLPMVADGRMPAEKAMLKGDDWYAALRIEYLRGRRISRLDGATHSAWLDDGTAIDFGKALIATGCRSRRIDVPGIDLPGIHRFKTLEDAQDIRESSSKAGGAVVIGGGFIALEFVNTFRRYGFGTTMCIRNKRTWQRQLDEKGSEFFERHLAGQGVRIIPEVAPLAFLGEEKVEGVKLSNGETIECAHVGLGVGLEPNIYFAENVGKTAHGILTDARLETDVPGVYAAGDIAEFEDMLAGRRHVLGNWFNAREQGRTAGANMAGGDEQYRQVSSHSIDVLGMNLAVVGDSSTEGSEIIARGDGNDSYALLYVRDGRLRGGVFMNRIADRTPALEIIRSQKDISVFKRDLSDSRFDLNSLLA